MSYIKISMGTNKETNDIDVNIKAECSLIELEVATAHLMGALAETSTTGLSVIKSLVADLERANGNRTDNTEEHN